MTKHCYTIVTILVLIVIGLIAIRPAPFHFQDGLPSPPGFSTSIHDNDPAMFCWNIWWIKGWITGKHNLFDSAMLHHPFGISLRRHTLSVANGILAVPLYYLFGPVPTYNLLIMFNSVLTAFAFFCLAREIGAGKSAALIASALFAWWPARLVHAAIHMNLASTGWLILALLFLFRACHNKSWKSVLPAILFFVMTGAASWHLHQQLCMLFPLAFFLEYKPGISVKQRAIRISVIMISGLLLLAPTIMPLAQNDPDIPGISRDESAQYSIEPTALLIPPAGNPLFKNLVASYYSTVPGNVIENTGFIGYSVLVLLIIGLFRRRYQDRLLIISGAFFTVLAFGPYILWGTSRMPLPGRILSSLPFLNYSRTPGRFMIAAGLLWCLACARVLTVLAQEKKWLLCLFTVFFLIEFFPGAHNIVSPGDLLECKINSVEQSTGILVVPNDWSNQYHMFAQTFHQRPMSTGFVSRMPNTVFQRISGIPYLAGLSDPATAYETMKVMRPLDWVRIRDLLAVDTLIFYSRFCHPVPVDAPIGLVHLQPKIVDSSLENMSPNMIVDLSQFTENLPEPECYLLDRWSGPENWGQADENIYWGLSPAARMRVLGAYSPIQISFEMIAAHQVGGVPVRVNILINQYVIHSVTLKPEDGWAPISFAIDFSSDAAADISSSANAFHDIWFDFSSGAAPTELFSSLKHSSSDTRQLSAAIRRLVVRRTEQ